MSEDGKILESLGKLSGLVEASREDIKTLVGKYDEQSRSIQNLTTCIQVVKTENDNRTANIDKDLREVNVKLGRDYIVLNNLKEKALVANGVEAYKGKKRDWWQWALGIVGAFVGILISINQLVSIGQKVKLSDINFGDKSIVSSVYAVPLDTLKDTTNFTMKTDTIRGN